LFNWLGRNKPHRPCYSFSSSILSSYCLRILPDIEFRDGAKRGAVAKWRGRQSDRSEGDRGYGSS
jgi:hypothetical protein